MPSNRQWYGYGYPPNDRPDSAVLLLKRKEWSAKRKARLMRSTKRRVLILRGKS